MSFYWIFARFYEKAGRNMCRNCESFIKKGAKILDLGCGSGIAGKTFKDFFQAELTGVDIKDKRVTEIPFQIIDGENIPFKDNFFDAVLINYVLHHSKDSTLLLKEAKRVTNGKIIIFEDLSEGLLSKLICWLHGISYNYFFQKNKEKGKFLDDENWKKVFNDLQLRLIFEKRVSYALNPVKKKLFILEK